ncbi:hemolysin activation/secretion protein [Sphingobium sp. B2D3A]|uniref:ShlB/FhaC/HecB family hemolysin secretion/activation protein n=1 Tax=unclassified Sphingobium TaxID=2611147 RepID=UPI0022252725|nr:MULTISPECIES: ShlB/FhaC/HecB family hemolysin secretion/activation protein [unclassified Sphingobium]MCW2336792.1 hemolysin activation/secretion protein [Sphingobium sp. B2D3A]MCW2386546.1 hemolysin activation/secretion protein [Sphingobium sp. B2D3D]
MVALLPAAIALIAIAQPTGSGLTPPLIDQSQPGPAPVLPAQERPAADDPTGQVAVEAQATATPIRSVTFSGVDAPAPVAEAARAFIGQPATRETLSALAKRISDAYAKTGIALYTVAIPQQDLAEGHVRVLLAEGFIEDIAYPKGASPLIQAYAAPLAREHPLSRRTLERSLSLMRDVPGAKIDANMLRGAQAGGVRLAITPEREHSDFSFGFDNRTQSGLGSGQWRASAKFYSLLRDGDRSDLTLLGAADLKRYRYAGFSHQTPLGTDGLTLGLSASWLDTRLQAPAIVGEAQTLGLSLSYPVIRGYKRNLTVSAGIDGLNSDAAYLGSVISSDRIRAVRAAAGYSIVADKSALSLALTGSRGFDMLGARGVPGFTDIDFTKIAGRANYDRMIGKRLVGRLRLSGQYSGDRLGGNERFSVGGPEIGRAFETALLSGDKGMAGLFELALRPKLPTRLQGSEVYGFVDGARVRLNARTGLPAASYSMASAGGGLRLNYTTRASLSLEAARVIEAPFPNAGDGWRFNIGWFLKLRR